MTCTYDGKMVVTKTEIEPCCGALHRAIIAGVIYRGDMTVKSSPKKIPWPSCVWTAAAAS